MGRRLGRGNCHAGLARHVVGNPAPPGCLGLHRHDGCREALGARDPLSAFANPFKTVKALRDHERNDAENREPREVRATAARSGEKDAQRQATVDPIRFLQRRNWAVHEIETLDDRPKNIHPRRCASC